MENSIMVFDKQGRELNVQCKIEDIGGGERSFTLINNTQEDIPVWEVVVERGVFENYSDDAMIYADGYEMLSQFYKKLSEVTPEDGMMTKGHYKMPQKEGFVVAYNYMYVEQPRKVRLIGATSCRRFYTECRFNNCLLYTSDAADVA